MSQRAEEDASPAPPAAPAAPKPKSRRRGRGGRRKKRSRALSPPTRTPPERAQPPCLDTLARLLDGLMDRFHPSLAGWGELNLAQMIELDFLYRQAARVPRLEEENRCLREALYCLPEEDWAPFHARLEKVWKKE